MSYREVVEVPDAAVKLGRAARHHLVRARCGVEEGRPAQGGVLDGRRLPKDVLPPRALCGEEEAKGKPGEPLTV